MWTLKALLFTLYSSILAAPLEVLIKVTVEDAGQTLYEYGPFPPEEGIIIGDIRINTHRNTLFINDIKWPNGRIPYVINSQYSSQVQDSIIAAMREIEQDVNGNTTDCVKFIPKTDEVNYIDIYPGTGCHTQVGLSNTGRQGVSIGRGCESKAVIMHELIHVLGFSHEHSRLDRDNYINVNMTNVNQNYTADYLRENIETFNTSYDFSSIMHYGPYTHAIDSTVPVITPKAGQVVGVKLGQSFALSDGDVIRIQRMYSCQEDITHISRTYLTDSVMRCDFENDLCNFTQNGTSNFLWEVTRGASGAGPRAGNTNGADAYLAAKELGRNGTARIVTPWIRINVNSICLDFFRFQGESSFLRVVVWGPRIARTVVANYQGNYSNGWHPVRLSLNIPAGAVFKIAFEVQLSSGDVAIDDVNMYKGPCV